jgi:hypothetical protein
MKKILAKFKKAAPFLKSMSVGDIFRLGLVRTVIPQAQITYSQFAEDIVLKVFFYGKPKGFFVDVGCNEPKRLNNTYLLYQRGWRGINIDGNEELIKKYAHCRKEDINLTQIISNEEGWVNFAVSTNSHVSTIDTAYKEAPGNTWEYPEDKKNRMYALTLNSVLKEHMPADAGGKIDLLCVDVEGHDLQVLKSIDLGLYKPTMIVVEMHGFTLETADSYDIYRYLKQNNYSLKYFSVINGYFVRNE